MVNAGGTQGQLQHLDWAVKQGIWSALHLSRDTHLGYFDAAVADGRLGIPSLEMKVTRLKVNLLQGLVTSYDLAVIQAAEERRGRESGRINTILEEEGRANKMEKAVK